MAGTTQINPEKSVSQSVLRVDDLQKSYQNGDGTIQAVNGVSFTVAKGEVVGLLGPNGAGKTTTIKSILGLIVPTSGQINICGANPITDPRKAYLHVGAMLEGARNIYWRLTVRENLSFFSSLGASNGEANRSRQDELLDRFDLLEKADTTVNELSRGQKQKVSLASTLARGTDLVFLDEPTLGLDLEASLELRQEICRLAEEEDITVVLSSHDMEVVEEVCDRIIILSNGAVIADDTVDSLLAVFGTESYCIEVISDEEEEAAHTALEERFGVINWARHHDRIQFEVTLNDDEDLYPVIDLLRDHNLSLIDVARQEPDFTEVFLDVTNNNLEGEQ